MRKVTAILKGSWLSIYNLCISLFSLVDSSRKPRFLMFVEAGLFNMHSESNFCLISAFSCVRSSFNFLIFKNNRWHLMHNQASWLSSLNSIKVLPSGALLLVTIVFKQFNSTVQLAPYSRFLVFLLDALSTPSELQRICSLPSAPCSCVRPIEQWRT